jgi:hypothetical protein
VPHRRSHRVVPCLPGRHYLGSRPESCPFICFIVCRLLDQRDGCSDPCQCQAGFNPLMRKPDLAGSRWVVSPAEVITAEPCIKNRRILSANSSDLPHRHPTSGIRALESARRTRRSRHHLRERTANTEFADRIRLFAIYGSVTAGSSGAAW